MIDARKIVFIRVALHALLMVGFGRMAVAQGNKMEMSNKQAIQTAFDAW